MFNQREQRFISLAVITFGSFVFFSRIIDDLTLLNEINADCQRLRLENQQASETNQLLYDRINLLKNGNELEWEKLARARGWARPGDIIVFLPTMTSNEDE